VRKSFILIGLCFLMGSVQAADQVIHLKDGSQIHGEVLSMQSGTYSVKTRSMGVIRVKSDQVQSIGGAQYPAVDKPAESTIQSIQSSLTSNQSVMSSILTLQDDPAMQAVLSDPKVMQAVQNMDMQALAQNPKIKALMNSPQMQRIQDSLR